MDGKKLKQRQFCLPEWSDMWGWQYGHPHSQGHTNAWRKVERVKGERRISCKLKGKVLTPAGIYVIMALTEKQ